MKYYKRANMYKASNVTFNPVNQEGFSYGWWKVSGYFKGQLFVNNYTYSNSTAKHINKIKALIEGRYILIEAPKGLDDFKAIEAHYQYKIKCLKEKLANKRTRKIKYYQWELQESEYELESAKKYIKNSEANETTSPLKIASVVANFGDILCDTIEEQNAWKKRMLSTVHGISFPDDFDSLPEEEKQKRLDNAINNAK